MAGNKEKSIIKARLIVGGEVARKKAKAESEFNKWRKRKGLSLADIARKTGIDYMTVARWSSGVNKRPRMAYRDKLRKVFPDCPLVLED